MPNSKNICLKAKFLNFQKSIFIQGGHTVCYSNILYGICVTYVKLNKKIEIKCTFEFVLGTEMQIYSVRLAKDKGPDYRGFVLVS